MALLRSSKPAASMADHIARLRAGGITDTALLEAAETIRHDQFVPLEHVHLAWGPAALPLPCGQLMPPPAKTAQLINALGLTGSESVLDIGTGSGYQAALLSKLARKVHSIDTYRTLVETARTLCGKLELANLTFAQSDILADGRKHGLGEGQGGQALYDRIICDSAFDDLPRDLIDILASGGIVVAPVVEGEGKASVMRLTKVGSRFERETLFEINATPIRPGLAETL